MGVKSLVQGLNAAVTAGFEPRTVWSEVRHRNRLATAPPSGVIKESVWNFEQQVEEDIDQDSGFVTEVMQPERLINKTIAERRKTLLLKKNEAS